jgi:type II secretion system protein G
MNRRAFTLVELLVVIAIIGLLSTVAVVSLSSAKKNAHNTKIKATLVQLSKALELYYSDNGGYPVSSFQGACANYGGLPDTDPGSWIPGLVSGGYIARLPRDPYTNGGGNPNSANSGCYPSNTVTCYGYISNGTDYKIVAHCLPDGPVSSTDPFWDPRGGGRNYVMQISTPAGVNLW